MSNNKAVYFIDENDPAFSEDYSILKGPNDWYCMLGEPEDSNWYRDGYNAVIELNRLHAENVKLKEVISELVLANPDCCWRKCWSCGKTQIHRDSITPGVLCRFCKSQDTRLLKKETEALKEKEI